MGCGVSRIDANGMTFPARLRPIFLQRLDEISVRKHNRPANDSTLSKKELLSHESDSSKGSKMMISSPKDSMSLGRNDEEVKRKESEKPKEEASCKENGIATSIGDKNGAKVAKEEILKGSGEIVIREKEEGKMEDVFMDVDNDDEDEDDDDDGRMIDHMDDQAFPGSPSFRIYYKDNGKDEHEKIGENGVVKDAVATDGVVTSKDESSMDEKVEKRSKKRRSFKKVLAKGLSVKSCYSSSHASHDRTRLLTEKIYA